MASINYKTRNMSNPQGKPRVYFCCHPEDFERYFEQISDDLLAKQNCAIYYLEDQNEVRDEEFFFDLKQMQLFVIPVTTNLLCTDNSAMAEEFPFAMASHIPVLPVLFEAGLENLYSQEDKFGQLQYLNPFSSDPTEIGYDEKLEKFLSSVLIGDELAEKVRAAFDAYVFLSYRKKDRKYAQELMRLIHKNEFCRDIAIWYDEFLAPGENFNDSIKAALQKSELFVLAVTPNLVNESNYIMTTEYPMARQEGKPILPAELVPTDRELLAEKYEDIPACTNAYNETELWTVFLEQVRHMAIRANDSPEHNFLVGLAYLDGIDVEVDRDKGIELISAAANEGLIEASYKLVDIYDKRRDKDKAIEWLNRLIVTEEAALKKKHEYSTFTKLLENIERLFRLRAHYKVYGAKKMFIRVVQLDAFLMENGLYKTESDEARLCDACVAVFGHRTKRVNIFADREEERKDIEEWLEYYENLSQRHPVARKDVLESAYLNYAEALLEEACDYAGCIAIANKLLQLSVVETEKHNVQFSTDYSCCSYFDVPDEIRKYGIRLEVMFQAHLLIAQACVDDGFRRIVSIRNMLELGEQLRRHWISYSVCDAVAKCYKLLAEVFTQKQKNALALRASEYAKSVSNGMPKRQKIIPRLDIEIYMEVDRIILENP